MCTKVALKHESSSYLIKAGVLILIYLFIAISPVYFFKSYNKSQIKNKTFYVP